MKDNTTAVREYTKRAPASTCKCGHTGDGANSMHFDSDLATEYGGLGHGACRDAGCDCRRFVWKKFRKDFTEFLAQEN